MYTILRTERIKKGISAKEMATDLGLKTTAGYYKKENGSTKTSVDEAILIARKLNKSVEEIFFKEYVS